MNPLGTWVEELSTQLSASPQPHPPHTATESVRMFLYLHAWRVATLTPSPILGCPALLQGVMASN